MPWETGHTRRVTSALGSCRRGGPQRVGQSLPRHGARPVPEVGGSGRALAVTNADDRAQGGRHLASRNVSYPRWRARAGREDRFRGGHRMPRVGHAASDDHRQRPRHGGRRRTRLQPGSEMAADEHQRELSVLEVRHLASGTPDTARGSGILHSHGVFPGRRHVGHRVRALRRGVAATPYV